MVGDVCVSSFDCVLVMGVKRKKIVVVVILNVVVIRKFFRECFINLKLFILIDSFIFIIGFINGEINMVLIIMVVELIFSLSEVMKMVKIRI